MNTKVSIITGACNLNTTSPILEPTEINPLKHIIRNQKIKNTLCSFINSNDAQPAIQNLKNTKNKIQLSSITDRNFTGKNIFHVNNRYQDSNNIENIGTNNNNNNSNSFPSSVSRNNNNNINNGLSMKKVINNHKVRFETQQPTLLYQPYQSNLLHNNDNNYHSSLSSKIYEPPKLSLKYCVEYHINSPKQELNQKKIYAKSTSTKHKREDSFVAPANYFDFSHPFHIKRTKFINKNLVHCIAKNEYLTFSNLPLFNELNNPDVIFDPSIEELRTKTMQELKSINQFIIRHKKYGEIMFLAGINLNYVSLDKIATFTYKNVSIDQKQLNRTYPVKITLFSAYQGIRCVYAHEKLERKLKNFCTKNNLMHLDINQRTGHWSFIMKP